MRRISPHQINDIGLIKPETRLDKRNKKLQKDKLLLQSIWTGQFLLRDARIKNDDVMVKIHESALHFNVDAYVKSNSKKVRR